MVLVHWEHLDHEAISLVSDQTVDAMRRALVPPGQSGLLQDREEVDPL